MEKLTSDLYEFTSTYSPATGTKVTIHHTEYGTATTFHTADPKVSSTRILEHVHSLTDSQCHQWLDPIRAEEEKKAAKEQAKQERLLLQAQVEKERKAKTEKKEENRRKQREALQRKQETQGN